MDCLQQPRRPPETRTTSLQTEPGNEPIETGYSGTLCVSLSWKASAPSVVYGGGIADSGGFQPPSCPAAKKSRHRPPNCPRPALRPSRKDAPAFFRPPGPDHRPHESGEAVYLADDWRTQGDWIGRYGAAYALLCGTEKGLDQAYPLQPGYKVTFTWSASGQDPETTPISGERGSSVLWQLPGRGSPPA